ncbi:MAG TPA: hypothetical protein VFW38_11460 [Solirubrobacteraceae bacterium]|nr:hypothetical protein [Solirubrobacteraceae bacterium]
MFGADGAFISMFGWEVDKTTKANLCTAASGDTCGAAGSVSGGPSGQISKPSSISVDQATGDVYILDFALHRIERYTASGSLVWMIGGDVNTVGSSEAETSICTVASGDTCQAGVESAAGAFPHGAFKPENQNGNVLFVGGPEDLVYLGDEGRVVEYNASTGAWVREISLTSLATGGHVKALGVAASGELYVVYSDSAGKGGGGIHVISSTGTLLREVDSGGEVHALALDPFGRLAAIDAKPSYHGLLYEASTGSLLSEFSAPEGMQGTQALAADADSAMNGEIYAAVSPQQEVQMFEPVPVVEPVTLPCKNRQGTSVVLSGEANPKEVTETKVWFQYGTTAALGLRTLVQEITTSHDFTLVEAPLTSLQPNQVFYYRLVGEDSNYKPAGGQEPLAGATLQCETLYLPPEVEDGVTSYEPTFSSVLVEGSLNPQHAHTTYWVEYGPCPQLSTCPDRQRSASLESSEYGVIGVRRALGGLQPSTNYSYALVAESENTGKTEKGEGRSEEGEFTTLPAPRPAAVTGLPGAVGVASATLTGTVDGGGADAVYSFEVGIYNGAATVYSAVVSAPLSAEAGSVSAEFGLTGLQADTTYAYRVKAQSAYGTSVGQPVAFTTVGLPAVPAAPALAQMLGLPSFEFPKAVSEHTGKSKKPKKKPKKKAKKGKKKSKAKKARHPAMRTAAGRAVRRR